MAKLKISLGLVLVMLGGLFQTLPAVAVEYDKAALPLLKRPFFYGRDYFVLGSGRTKMIVQADKADLGPAFLYLLFDADNVLQSKDKHRALNFADGQGMVNSALEVVLGGHAFTAFGHQTQTRWTVVDGIPAVEAVWWAGGLRVTERIFALTGKNAFVRRIQLDSVNLAGPEKATLRLSLPPGKCAAQDGAIVQDQRSNVYDVALVRKAAQRGIDRQGGIGDRPADPCARPIGIGGYRAVGAGRSKDGAGAADRRGL